MKTRIFFVSQVLIAAVFFTVAYGQTLKLNPKTFNMTILGTTNVHNFQSVVTVANGELVIDQDKHVQSLSVEIPVKGIKSKEKLMDEKTYSAFNAEKNPNINFKLTVCDQLQVTGTDINVIVSGNMTMNGTTRRVTLKANGKIVKPGVYQFKGTIPLKMTDFKMTPPTALFGAMKVGDAITLKYDVTFEGAVINS